MEFSTYQVQQVITYLVVADSEEEALNIWNADPRCGVVEWQSDKIALVEESIEVN